MPGELFLLTKDMIDWENQTILGCGLKTKKRKKTPIVIADCIIPVLRYLCDTANGDKICVYNRHNFAYAFDAMLRKAGCRDLTPYSCRHTAGTAATTADGASLVAVKEAMRHTKLSTTERYIHPDTKYAFEAFNKIGGQTGGQIER